MADKTTKRKRENKLTANSDDEYSPEDVNIFVKEVEVSETCQGCSMNLRESIVLSFDNEKLFNFLVHHGTLQSHFICPSCGDLCKLLFDSLKWHCRRVRKHPSKSKKSGKIRCNTVTSVKANSFFSGSHFDLATGFNFIHYWLVVPFLRQKFLQEQTKLTSKTIVNLSSYCREVCLHWVETNSVKLGGPNKVVEIEEAKFAKRKDSKGGLKNNQWIFGGFERDSNKIFLVSVENGTSTSLLDVIKHWILPGTTLVSDIWKEDKRLQSESFQTLKDQNSLQFLDPETQESAKEIKKTWRDVWSYVPRNGQDEAHFLGYLAEYLFKKANRGPQILHTFLLSITSLYDSVVQDTIRLM